MDQIVIAVSLSETHSFSKTNQPAIELIEDFGVDGDAHSGKTVKHRFLVNKDATKPNIRQVHLIHIELLDFLEEKGFTVHPGQLGENITTRGVDLLELPTDTILKIGEKAVVKITALRNPCKQIDEFQKGIFKEVLYKDEEGNLVRKTGVMGVVLNSGMVRPGDTIQIELPSEPHQKLEYVW
jgi:MOSC domain-containing protein YiiM